MDLLFQLKVVAGFFITAFLYNLSIVRSKARKNRPQEAPEPAGRWPIIGHLHLLGGDQPLIRTLGAMADKYGPTFTIWVGMRRTLVVSSWEVAKECFTINDKVLATRPQCAAAEHMGYNYAMFGFAPYGPYWRDMRKIAMLELLSNRRMELLSHVRAGEVDMAVKDLYRLWVKNEEQPVKVEMKQWFGDLSFNVSMMMIAGKRYFGSNVSSEEAEEARAFRGSMLKLLYLTGVFVVSDALPILKWFDFKGHEAAMKRTAEEMDVLVGRWVEEHRQRRDSGEAEEQDADFIDVMLSTIKDGKMCSHEPDTIVKATTLALISGATDSTSLILTWALSLLLNHPNALKRAQDELDINVGRARIAEEFDFNDLPYLQSVVKETMRLYTAMTLPHEAREDCHVAGYHIPAGTRILVNLWKLHQDPRNWDHPLEFRPERFLSGELGEVDVRGHHFKYIPFGFGRRSCPGIAFALHALHLTLARLLHAFNMSTPDSGPVDMTEGLGFTLPKANPLEVLFTPRLSSNLYM